MSKTINVNDSRTLSVFLYTDAEVARPIGVCFTEVGATVNLWLSRDDAQSLCEALTDLIVDVDAKDKP